MWQQILDNLQHYPSLVLVATTVAVLMTGLAAQVLANRLEIPSILFLLLGGILLGPDGLGLVRPEVYGVGLRAIIAICVAIVVFEGALLINLKHLRHASHAVLGLISLGIGVTTLATAALANWLMAIPFNIALLFGAIVSITGPTVVIPILRRLTLSQRLKATLEGEAIFADAVGVILAASIFSYITAGHADPTVGLTRMVSHILIGGSVGATLALVSVWTLRRLAPLPGEHVRLGVLGTALLVYAVAELLAHETGIMAAAIAGTVFGSVSLPYTETIKQFKGDLTVLCLSLVFILLAANLPLSLLFALGWPAILLVVLMMLVVRPIAVLLSTWGSDMPWREKGFLALLAPRGIVAASAATFFSLELTAWNIAGAEQLAGLVFLVVIMTVALQASAAPYLARLLGVLAQRIVILGGDKQARRLAQDLVDRDEPVLLLDDNLDHVHSLLSRQLPAKLCNLSEPDALARQGARDAKALVVATGDDERNLALATMVREHFPHTRMLIRLNDEANRETFRALKPEFWPQISEKKVSTSPLSVWNAAIEPELVLEAVVHNPAFMHQPLGQLGLPRGCLIISLKRHGQTVVPNGATELERGDRATIVGEVEAVQQTQRLLEAPDVPTNVF